METEVGEFDEIDEGVSDKDLTASKLAVVDERDDAGAASTADGVEDGAATAAFTAAAVDDSAASAAVASASVVATSFATDLAFGALDFRNSDAALYAEELEIADLKSEFLSLAEIPPRVFFLKVENDDEDVDDDDEGCVASKLAVVDANDGTGGVDVDEPQPQSSGSLIGEY